MFKVNVFTSTIYSVIILTKSEFVELKYVTSTVERCFMHLFSYARSYNPNPAPELQQWAIIPFTSLDPQSQIHLHNISTIK